jgi:hypothetical protein
VPSLGDVANQALDVLNQIQANTNASSQTDNQIKADTDDIKAELSTVETELASIQAALTQGFFAMVEQEKVANSLLLREVHQNDAIICWLTNIAEVLCRILHRTTTEVKLQTEMRETLSFLGAINELVHSRETVEIHRLDRVEDRVEDCCPPEKREPEPCFEPCKVVESPIYKPQGGEVKVPVTRGPK